MMLLSEVTPLIDTRYTQGGNLLSKYSGKETYDEVGAYHAYGIRTRGSGCTSRYEDWSISYPLSVDRRSNGYLSERGLSSVW